MPLVIERCPLVFAAGHFQVIDPCGGEVPDYAVDRLGPLLAAPSPGTAELHDQDVPFELIE